MFERHFRSFKTIDRVRSLWLGPQIELHVQALEELHTSTSHVRQQVRTLTQFNDFVLARGATRLEELPSHVDAFVEHWLKTHGGWCRNARDTRSVTSNGRVSVERMLVTVLPSYKRPSKVLTMPFEKAAPGFLPFLLREKGLSQATVHGYKYTLRPFETYLTKAGLTLADLKPSHITEFLGERSSTLHKTGMVKSTGSLRALLKYLHREELHAHDLSLTVPRKRTYRDSSIPRAISWCDVEKLLASIDRRSDAGKRDFAILTLLASYGLRAREIAALTLNDLNWSQEQINIPMRKGGHSTRYPLSASAGEAIIAYLQVRRTDVEHREIFLTSVSPFMPMKHWTISSMVGRSLHKADIKVARAGSHTLRHACVQRLVDADIPFKIIGDYVGHRHPASTLIYGKVAVHKLREIVLIKGEDIL